MGDILRTYGHGERGDTKKVEGFTMSNVIAFPKNTTSKADCSPLPDILSFVQRRKPRGGGFDYWSIFPSGNYSADCEQGKALAAEYLAFIGKHPTVGNSTLLNCIVRQMIEHAATGKGWSGVHLGFIQAINKYAMATAEMMQSCGKPA